MVQEAVRKPVKPGRFHPPAFHVQLDQRDALNEPPWDDIRRHVPGLWRVFPHDEPHFLRLVASAGTSHALEERGYGEGRIDLERAFEPSDIDAQFEGRRRDGGHAAVLILHVFFGALSDGRGEVAVMDEESIRFVLDFAILAQGGCHRFRFFAGIAEYQAFAAACMFEDVSDARIGHLGGRIGGRLRYRRRWVGVGGGVPLRAVKGSPRSLLPDAAVRFGIQCNGCACFGDCTSTMCTSRQCRCLLDQRQAITVDRMRIRGICRRA